MKQKSYKFLNILLSHLRNASIGGLQTSEVHAKTIQETEANIYRCIVTSPNTGTSHSFIH